MGCECGTTLRNEIEKSIKMKIEKKKKKSTNHIVRLTKQQKVPKLREKRKLKCGGCRISNPNSIINMDMGLVKFSANYFWPILFSSEDFFIAPSPLILCTIQQLLLSLLSDNSTRIQLLLTTMMFDKIQYPTPPLLFHIFIFFYIFVFVIIY